MADVLIGGGACARAVCEPMGPNDTPNERFGCGVGVGAGVDLLQWGFLSLGLGARYRLLRTGVDARTGEQDFTLHPGRARADAQRRRARPVHARRPRWHHPRLVLGLHVPVGWVHAGGEDSLSVGGELVMQFPLM